LNYTEKRKADRAYMAQKISDLARSYGATVERGEFVDPGDHRIEIEINGLRVGVDFERRSIQPDVFVLPWNTTGKVRLRPEFAPGNVNPHHFGKATLVAYGFEDLCGQIEHGLRLAQSGEAFQSARLQGA